MYSRYGYPPFEKRNAAGVPFFVIVKWQHTSQIFNLTGFIVNELEKNLRDEGQVRSYSVIELRI